jgi:hypothetical protein
MPRVPASAFRRGNENIFVSSRNAFNVLFAKSRPCLVVPILRFLRLFSFRKALASKSALFCSGFNLISLACCFLSRRLLPIFLKYSGIGLYSAV